MLSVKELTKTFGGVAALKDFSHSFQEGTITALIGPNAAGKTTLINALCGFSIANKGQVTLRGISVNGLNASERARLGIVKSFQEPRVFGGLSVFDNLKVAAIFRGASTGKDYPGSKGSIIDSLKLSQDLLHKFGIAEDAENHASLLSYGQKRLLSIANCLASNPDVLLLDEPVSGIQPNIRKIIAEELKSWLGRGSRCVVFAEHNLSFVKEYADNVVIMSRGRKVFTGSPEEVSRGDLLSEVFMR